MNVNARQIASSNLVRLSAVTDFSAQHANPYVEARFTLFEVLKIHEFIKSRLALCLLGSMFALIPGLILILLSIRHLNRWVLGELGGWGRCIGRVCYVRWEVIVVDGVRRYDTRQWRGLWRWVDKSLSIKCIVIGGRCRCGSLGWEDVITGDGLNPQWDIADVRVSTHGEYALSPRSLVGMLFQLALCYIIQAAWTEFPASHSVRLDLLQIEQKVEVWIGGKWVAGGG